jgi:hypothetical protein
MHEVQGKGNSTKETCLLKYLELVTTHFKVEMAGQGLFSSKSEGGSGVLGFWPPDVSARRLKQDHSREIFDKVRRNLEDELQRGRIWNVNDLGKLLKFVYSDVVLWAVIPGPTEIERISSSGQEP